MTSLTTAAIVTLILWGLVGPFFGWLLGFGQGADYEAKAKRELWHEYIGTEAKKENQPK